MIRERVATLQAIIEKCKKAIEHIQLQECSHPAVVKSFHADTGNWDRRDDHYWVDFKCPDCGRFWIEDQ